MLRQSRVRCPLSYFSLKVVDPPPRPKPRCKWLISLSLSQAFALPFIGILYAWLFVSFTCIRNLGFVPCQYDVLRSLHLGGRLDFWCSLEPVRSAGNQAYPGGRPFESIIFVMFFFCCQDFHFYSLLILPNIPIGPNSEMVRSGWFLTEISGILGCVESAHNLMIWSDGK